jgi:hypothetical protein
MLKMKSSFPTRLGGQKYLNSIPQIDFSLIETVSSSNIIVIIPNPNYNNDFLVM